MQQCVVIELPGDTFSVGLSIVVFYSCYVINILCTDCRDRNFIEGWMLKYVEVDNKPGNSAISVISVIIVLRLYLVFH